jgi:hypothetical protein
MDSREAQYRNPAGGGNAGKNRGVGVGRDLALWGLGLASVGLPRQDKSEGGNQIVQWLAAQFQCARQCGELRIETPIDLEHPCRRPLALASR